MVSRTVPAREPHGAWVVRVLGIVQATALIGHAVGPSLRNEVFPFFSL